MRTYISLGNAKLAGKGLGYIRDPYLPTKPSTWKTREARLWRHLSLLFAIIWSALGLALLDM